MVIPSGIQAQSISDILAHHWKAIDTISSTAGLSSRLIVEQSIDSLQIDSNNNYTAAGKTIIIADGKQYVMRYKISGVLGVKIKKKKVWITYQEDGGRVKIPIGKTFCPTRGELYLYRDNVRPGKYFLEGTLTEQCGYSSEHTVFYDQ